MAQFTVRVELHEAKDHHYETLHTEMEKVDSREPLRGLKVHSSSLLANTTLFAMQQEHKS